MSTSTKTEADVSHAEVGRLLGCNFSMASRLRSGLRHPSVQMIGTIERVFGWKAGAQVKSANAGTYAADFEQCLIRKYGEKVGGDE